MVNYSDITSSELRYKDIWVPTGELYNLWVSECGIPDIPDRHRVVPGMYTEVIRYFFERYMPVPSVLYIPSVTIEEAPLSVYAEVVNGITIAAINEMYRYLARIMVTHDTAEQAICYLIKSITEHDILISKGY